MFGQVGRTELDLHFSLFGIPVRIHPGFWLVSVLMGRDLIERPELLVIWILVVFVSILIHELGHALAAMQSGYPVEIVLYHFGGYASFVPSHGTGFGKRYTHWRAIWILLAGPFAGFVFYGVVIGVEYGLIQMVRQNGTQIPFGVWFAIFQLKYINLWWGLVNLLPVFPLDGGQICRELLGWKIGQRADEYTFLTGIIVGLLVACGFGYLEQRLSYPVILFAFLAFTNFQNYQQVRSGPW